MLNLSNKNQVGKRFRSNCNDYIPTQQQYKSTVLDKDLWVPGASRVHHPLQKSRKLNARGSSHTNMLYNYGMC